jgi:hypothetical protein
MIAAITGALVSEIVVDKSVLLNLDRSSIIIKSFYILHRDLDRFYVCLLYMIFSKNDIYFLKQTQFYKSTFRNYIWPFSFIFPLLFE